MPAAAVPLCVTHTAASIQPRPQPMPAHMDSDFEDMKPYATPVHPLTHVIMWITTQYSFTDPRGMEGWVGIVGWSIADSLPTCQP